MGFRESGYTTGKATAGGRAETSLWITCPDRVLQPGPTLYRMTSLGMGVAP